MRVWITSDEAPADGYTLECRGGSERLASRKGFARAFIHAPARKPAVRFRKLGAGAWAGTFLSRDGALVVHGHGGDVAITARAFGGEEAQSRMVRSVEAAVLQLMPREVRLTAGPPPT